MMNKLIQGSFLALLSAMLLTACASQKDSAPLASAEKRIKIVTTFPPLYSLVSNVAGEKAEITNLVPPGTSVHIWEPKASALRNLSDADLFVMNGLNLESFAEDLIESVQNPRLKILVTGDAVQADLRETSATESLDEDEHDDDHHHDGLDPHIWLSPSMAIKQVEAIKEALNEVDPLNAQYYSANASAYIDELTDLNRDIRTKFDEGTKENFIVFHNAYDYFLSEYGLLRHKKAAIELFPGKEPGAAYFHQLINLIRKQNITVIFTEPQFNPRVVENILEETGIKSFEIDPIGLELSKRAYVKNINAIAETFIEAFRH